MEATSGRSTIEDDVSAALRRAFGFAGLFALTAVAAIACTARTPQPVAGIATDRLMAQEAMWQAEANDAQAIAFPPALLARRKDPKVAAVLADVQQQLTADRAASAARRTLVIRQIDEARAQRDLYESQRTVLSMKMDQAYAMMQQRGADRTSAASSHELTLLKAEAAKANGEVVLATRKLNALSERMLTLANADRKRATAHLEQVRSQLRGG
ncbi:MAG: hypothetical protein PGN16_14105 [Sphingomonas phyllosphaerae]|uniref:hypothetical protein n=1 Tax=Sphingomonas phyllosphaerae TaxID=257003 RepID=UPI002FF6D1ED